MADFIIDKSVDITNAVCPNTFVKAKEAMDELDAGKILSIRMNDGDVRDFPRSLKQDGHQILKLVDNSDGTHNFIVRK